MLSAIIEKKMNVPTNVKILLKKPSRPTILRVAAAIRVMLDIIKKVAPPLAPTKSPSHEINPTSKSVVTGMFAPPFSAKPTELNKPPITKKNRKIFTIERLMGLRVSDGLTARWVIFNPYKNPTTNVGANMMFIKIGVSFEIWSISG